LTANYFVDSDVGEDAIEFQSNLTQQTKSGIFQGCAGSGIVPNRGKHTLYICLFYGQFGPRISLCVNLTI